MTKLGIVVGENGNDIFFRQIYDDLSQHYQTQVYKERVYNTPLLYGRLNRWALQNGLKTLLQRNDICFFEWAGELLMRASHMNVPKRAAIVTRLHSFEIYQWAPKINWNAVDKIVLVSNAMQKIFCELYPDQAHKTEVVYNGRSLQAFSPPANREFHFNLGMLCNIKPIKRVYEAILMFYDLRSQGYDAHLHIAGEPKGDHRYAASVYRLVKNLNLEDHVTFYGYVADPERWLQKIDIFILNSFWEGHPVAMLEAMATGCYCLSHYWAGAEEMLPQENLYLTDTELRQKIIEFAQMSHDEKENRQRKLRSIACEKFDVLKTVAHIRRVIEEVEQVKI